MKPCIIALLSLPLIAWGAKAQNTSQQAGGAAQGSASVSGDNRGDQSGVQTQTSAGASVNQTSAATEKPGTEKSAANSLSSGTIIQAELSKSVDAKKAKQGDQVTAKTTEDVRGNSGVVIPKGSKLIGHIARAKARTKGDANSNLVIAWDKAVLKHGEEIPLHASLQAIGRPRSAPMGLDDSGGMEGGGPGTNSGSAGRVQPGGGMGGRSSGSLPGPAGGAAGGVAGAAGNAAGGAANTAGSATGVHSGGVLDARAQGVAGLPGITLNNQAAATQGSEISSEHGNLRLESGTQLLLRVP